MTKLAVLAALPLALLAAPADDVLSPREFLRQPPEADAQRTEWKVRGVVTFVSNIDGSFAVAPQDNPRHAGVVVAIPKTASPPEPGDLVQVAGRAVRRNTLPSIDAGHVDVIRRTTLPVGAVSKQADFRRGLLFNRRISLTGTASELNVEATPDGPVTSMYIMLEDYLACVRVPGAVNEDEILGRPVRVTGFAYNKYSGDGRFVDPEMELSGTDAIDILDEDKGEGVVTALVYILSGAVLVSLGSLFMLWRRDVRVRREIAVVAAERRRMAADLHDTIEQHLAGANLLAAGVLALEDAPPDVVDAMKTLTGLLANAKAEVRSAVMNLRSADAIGKSLAESLDEIAVALEKTGVNTRKLLRGLPEGFSESEVQDILLIVREATTNALKHGKARTIVFTSDPAPDGGCILRVLNDGAPFEPDAALGPETGHYGLSGMRERALRCKASLNWGRTGKWTYVELRFGPGGRS